MPLPDMKTPHQPNIDDGESYYKVRIDVLNLSDTAKELREQLYKIEEILDAAGFVFEMHEEEPQEYIESE